MSVGAARPAAAAGLVARRPMDEQSGTVMSDKVSPTFENGTIGPLVGLIGRQLRIPGMEVQCQYVWSATGLGAGRWQPRRGPRPQPGLRSGARSPGGHGVEDATHIAGAPADEGGQREPTVLQHRAEGPFGFPRRLLEAGVGWVRGEHRQDPVRGQRRYAFQGGDLHATGGRWSLAYRRLRARRRKADRSRGRRPKLGQARRASGPSIRVGDGGRRCGSARSRVPPIPPTRSRAGCARPRFPSFD